VVSEGARERKGWAAVGEGLGGEVAEEARIQPRRRKALADVRGKEMKRGEGRGAEVEAGAVAAGRREERSGAAIVVDEMRGAEGDVAAASVGYRLSRVGKNPASVCGGGGGGNPSV
jgi:hypothetical protein